MVGFIDNIMVFVGHLHQDGRACGILTSLFNATLRLKMVSPSMNLPALRDFTQRYVAHWQRLYNHAPCSRELYDIPSPCRVEQRGQQVFWLQVDLPEKETLDKVELALDLQIRPEAHLFYTEQYAGDMAALWDGLSLVLLQVWSAEDFVRLQENLIGHLVMQKRLKLSPSLFLATTDVELEVISLCNLTGNVVLEKIGSRQRTPLTSTLDEFLLRLIPGSVV